MIIHDLATVKFLAENKYDQGTTQLIIKSKIVSTFTNTHMHDHHHQQQPGNRKYTTCNMNKKQIFSNVQGIKGKKETQEVEIYVSGI